MVTVPPRRSTVWGEHRTGKVDQMPFFHDFAKSTVYGLSHGADVMIPWYMSSLGYGFLWNLPLLWKCQHHSQQHLLVLHVLPQRGLLGDHHAHQLLLLPVQSSAEPVRRLSRTQSHHASLLHWIHPVKESLSQPETAARGGSWIHRQVRQGSKQYFLIPK